MIKALPVVSEVVLATAPKSALLNGVVRLNRNRVSGLAKFVRFVTWKKSACCEQSSSSGTAKVEISPAQH